MKLYFDDCITVLAGMTPDSVDSCVTDPPYHLTSVRPSQKSEWGAARIKSKGSAVGFMGKDWDGGDIAYRPETWAAVLRVMKPGAHLLAFGGTRTHHRMVCAIEDAGFEIRDEIDWVYGQGFPKSLNFEDGWGTALKPAKEPICLARKPLVGTVEENRVKYGTGGINIDECRISSDARPLVVSNRRNGNNTYGDGLCGSVAIGDTTLGRWPANVIHDGSPEVLAAFPDAGQQRPSVEDGEEQGNNVYGAMRRGGPHHQPRNETDKSAARFFYCAKATKADREEGCDHLPLQSAADNVDREPDSAGMNSPRAGAGRTAGRRNSHPTVKPTDLMRYLCRLITPIGGTILDPFMGSGSTGKAALLEGFDFIGIEKDPAYAAIAKARIRRPALELDW